MPFSQRYPAESASVARVRDGIRAFVAHATVAPRTLDDIQLAVSEAANNVVLHAYTNADAPGDIGIDADFDGDDLVVSVTDTGSGLRARTDSPGLGLGLAIIGGVADNVEMLRGDGGGLRIVMRFRLSDGT